MRTIALVTSSFLPRFGGVEEHVLNVARTLRGRGHRVVIWAVDQYDDGAPASVDGIPVRFLPCPLPARSVRALARFAVVGPLAAARWLAAWRADRPAVLHVHCFGPNGVFATGLARVTRTPLIVSSHGETFMDADRVFEVSALLRRALRHALDRADAVTACSAFTAAHLEARYGLAPGGAVVVHNGIDADEPAGPAPSWLPERYVLGVGRLVRTKGFDLLLDAFAAAAQAGTDLVIGGDGPERAALASRAAALGLTDRVHLPGRLSRPEVVTVMARAAVLVVPSRIEAFGITVLEGWRAGVPVIATAHGGPPEFVSDGETGLVVDPTDVGALARAITRLLGDPSLARRLGEAGREAAARFTWERAAASYEALYRVVVPRRVLAGAAPTMDSWGSTGAR